VALLCKRETWQLAAAGLAVPMPAAALEPESDVLNPVTGATAPPQPHRDQAAALDADAAWCNELVEGDLSNALLSTSPCLSEGDDDRDEHDDEPPTYVGWGGSSGDDDKEAEKAKEVASTS